MGRAAVLANIFLVLLGLGALSPVLPSIQGDFNASYTAISWSVAAFAIARLVTDLAGGRIAGWRFGRLSLLIGGSVLVAAGAILSAVSPTLTLFVMGRAVTGLGSGLCTTVGLTVIMDAAAADRAARSASYYWSALTAGAFFGPGFGGLLAAVGSWRAAMAGAAGAAVLSAAFLLLLALRGQTGGFHPASEPPLGQTDGSGSPATTSTAVRPLLVIAFVVVAALFFVRGGIQQTLVPLMAEAYHGLGSGAIAALLMASAGLAAVFGPLVGAVADRYGTRALLLVAVVTLGVGTIGLVNATTLLGFVLGVVVTGIPGTASGIPPALVAAVSVGAQRAQYLGFYRFVGDLALAVGPLVTGLMIERVSFQAAGLAVGICVLLLTIPIALAQRAHAVTGSRPGAAVVPPPSR